MRIQELPQPCVVRNKKPVDMHCLKHYYSCPCRTDVDKARTGDLPFVFEPGFGFEKCACIPILPWPVPLTDHP